MQKQGSSAGIGRWCSGLCGLLVPMLLGAAEIPAGSYRAATLEEKPQASVVDPLFERLRGAVGTLELEYVGDEGALVRSGGQILWRQAEDEASMTFSASWTEGAEIFTRTIIIPKHAEEGIRFGGIIDAWSGGRRVDRVLLLVAP
jgi:hypothetical protein